MKTIKIYIFLGLSLLLAFCSAKNKNVSGSVTSMVKESRITESEKNVVNDFLKAELIKEHYKPYKDFPICVVKEELGKLHPLKIYEYCYNDRDLPLKNSTNKDWILNETQIKERMETAKNSPYHKWEVSDFTAFNVNIIESGELTRSIKESTYINLPKRLIIYLSTPLMIDQSNAFMSVSIGDSSLGFSTIKRFTALLKNSKEGKWVIDSYYYDPNSTW